MKKSQFGRGLGIWVVAAIGGMVPAAAELPSLMGENRWLGYFVGYENRRCSLAIAANKGQIVLRPIGKNGKAPAQRVFVAFDCQILESMPDGSTKEHRLIPASLESGQEATQEPKNLTIRGKVKGGAGFEFTLHEDSGKFSLGGRVLDAGSITNPLRFSVRAKIQNGYPSQKMDPDKQRQKVIEDKMKRDRILVTLADGKRLRPSTSEVGAAGAVGLDGALATAVQVEFSSWLDNRLQLEATGGSTMRMEVSGGNPLWKGFSLVWSADPKKDPQSKATLEIEMK
jgi:hypothetical protein